MGKEKLKTTKIQNMTLKKHMRVNNLTFSKLNSSITLFNYKITSYKSEHDRISIIAVIY